MPVDISDEFKTYPEHLQDLALAVGYLKAPPEEQKYLEGMTILGRVHRFTRLRDDRVTDDNIFNLLEKMNVDPDLFADWGMSFSYATRETGVKNFAKYKQPNPNNVNWGVYNESISFVFEDEAKYIADVPLWDEREAFHQLNLKASPGYPWNQIASTTEQVIAMVGEGWILDAWKDFATRWCIEFYASSQKSEGRLMEKLLVGGIRNFLAACKRMNYVGNRLFGAQREMYIRHFRQLQHTAGDSKFHGGWHAMYSRMRSSRTGANALKYWFDLDVSKMDAKMYAVVKRDLLDFEWRLLPNEVRTDPVYQQIFSNYARNSIFSLVVLESGTVVLLNGGNKSGEDGTIYFNIRWLKILLRYSWIVLTGEECSVMDDHVNFEVLGDDGLFGVDEEYVHLFNYSNVRDVIFSHWNIDLESLTHIPRPLESCIFLGHMSLNYRGMWVPYPYSNKILVVWLKGLKRKYKENTPMSLMRTNAVLIEVWFRKDFRDVVLPVRDAIHRAHLEDNTTEWRVARSTSFSSYEIEALYLKSFEAPLHAVALINQLHKEVTQSFSLTLMTQKVIASTPKALLYACADKSKVAKVGENQFSAQLTSKQLGSLLNSEHAKSILRIQPPNGVRGATPVAKVRGSGVKVRSGPSLASGLRAFPAIPDLVDTINKVDLRKEFKADRAAARGEKKSKFKRILDDIIGAAGTIAPFLPLFLAAKHAPTQQKLAAAGVDLQKEGVLDRNGIPFAQHVDLSSKVGMLDMKVGKDRKSGKINSMRITAFDEIGELAPEADLDRGDVALDAAIAPQVGVFANTRVSKLAGCWEKYKVHYASLIYDPSCAADVSGSLGGYGDRDPEDRPFDDGERAIKRAAAHAGYDQCVLYQAGHFELPKQRNDMWLFMDAHGSDARLTEAGVFSVYATSHIEAAGAAPAIPSYGTFYVLYDIEFILPQLDDDLLGFGAYAHGDVVPVDPGLGAVLNMWGVNPPTDGLNSGNTFTPKVYDRGDTIVGRWGWYGFSAGQWLTTVTLTGTSIAAASAQSVLSPGVISIVSTGSPIVNGTGTAAYCEFKFRVSGRCSSFNDGFVTWNVSATGSVTGINFRIIQIPDAATLERSLTLQDYEKKIVELTSDLERLKINLPRMIDGEIERFSPTPKRVSLCAKENGKSDDSSVSIDDRGNADSISVSVTKASDKLEKYAVPRLISYETSPPLDPCRFCGDPAPSHAGSACPQRRAIARPK